MTADEAMARALAHWKDGETVRIWDADGYETLLLPCGDAIEISQGVEICRVDKGVPEALQLRFRRSGECFLTHQPAARPGGGPMGPRSKAAR